ncbi:MULTISPECIES: cell division regulator GpsB [unclassified Rummeliibacillus]|uniref:cell division regulator GpsB n=1 Tax=unclassified Rummeliibacillus TaxID=2622809 RepID=UPI001F3503D4|nr:MULTISPECIES: cell division regulator GpsB [unclassified Rummeliibacillus]
MEMDIKLSAKTILDKDFKTGIRGYSQDEVDQFLDIIIQDYESFEKALAKKQQEVDALKNELKQVQLQATTTEPRRQSTSSAYTNNTNFDILKRIANLEKHVFGDKLYD